VYSLFEITLSAIDSKLRRVDSLERNMEMMLAKLSENSARSDAILTQLKVMDGRLNRMSPPGSGSSTTTTSTGGSAGTASSATSSSDREYSLEPRILALDEKVSQIGSKLNVLTYQLDSNSLLWAGLANYNETGRAGSEDYVSSSSEQARAYISVPQIRGDKLIDRRGSDWNGNAEDTESIRTTMSSMDRHLKILIELFSEQMDKMMSAVADVRTAVITSNPDPSSSLLLTAPESPVLLTSGRSSSVGNAKLDQLYQKMAPLLDVSEKMDQVWNVLIGAKSSVDSLVPTSEALLWQTQRQERALTDIHTELNIKTKQIIDNLNLLQLANVRDSTSAHAGSVPGGISSSSTATTSTTSSTSSTSSRSTAPGSVSPATSNLTKRSKSDVHDGAGIILANKPQESQQVSVTFKQTEIPTSRGVVGSGSVATASQSLIRAQELSPGPVVAAVLAAAKSSTTTSTTTTPLPLLLPPPPEVVPIPSDIMDSEFLHDDPIVVLTANQTSTGSSSSGGSPKSGENKKVLSLQPSTASVSAAAAAVIAAAATANISSTTSRSVLLQHIVPAGPTERSRIPNNSNVIFPSVKNKPGFTNTTFFYDYTTPQNIRVR
jgi:hypothetical protein